jgi:hypothetical protein
MAMSDCVKCWETPCMCGYEYKNRSLEFRLNLASVVLGVSVLSLKELYIPDIHPKINNPNWSPVMESLYGEKV